MGFVILSLLGKSLGKWDLFVSSELTKCRLLKWLLADPVSFGPCLGNGVRGTVGSRTANLDFSGL